MSKSFQCQVCHKTKEKVELVPFAVIRPAVTSLIKLDHPELSDTGYICHEDLNIYRNKYIQQILEEEKGDITYLEESVIQSIVKKLQISLPPMVEAGDLL